MRRRVLASLVPLAATALLALNGSPALAQPVPQQKFASLMIDAATGDVLHNEMADQVRYPASLTKIMTLYIAFEEIDAGRLSLDDRIVMSAHASSQPPSKLGVRAGESLTVEEALNALVVKSANDIAVAVAEHIGGSERAFAKRMTTTAHGLGMKDTEFRNASGLPDRHQVTTAKDIAVLAQAVMRDHPQHYPIFSRQSFTFRGQTYTGHNRVTQRMAGADGLKTGYINASGFNLVTSAQRDGQRLIGVVLGGRTTATRDAYMETLFERSFQTLRAAAPKDPIGALIAGLDVIAAN